jgi:hypothetical protein
MITVGMSDEPATTEKPKDGNKGGQDKKPLAYIPKQLKAIQMSVVNGLNAFFSRLFVRLKQRYLINLIP